MRKTLKFVLLFLFTISYGQSLDTLQNKSYEAYQLGKYQEFKALNLRMLKLHPSHPGVLFNTAVSYGKLNQIDSLDHYLRKLISWDAHLNLDPIATLQFDKKNELMEGLKTFALAYKTKVSKSKDYLEFEGKHHFEDLLWERDTLYLTDIHQKSIIRVWPGNQMIDTLVQFTTSPLAMVKGTKKDLWISLANPFSNGNPDTKSHLVQIDRRNGNEIRRLELPSSSLVGSMVRVDHTIFATDSGKPQIFVIDTNSGKITTTLVIEECFNLQGITYNPNNGLLYIADYIKGVLAVEVESLEPLGWVKSNNYLLKGLDGIIHLMENYFVAVQNNASPMRLVKIKIENSLVMEALVLENCFESVGEPTNLTVFNNKIYFVANSPWPQYDKNGKPKLEDWPKPLIKFLPIHTFPAE